MMDLPDFLSPPPYDEFKGHCVLDPKDRREDILTQTYFWPCSCGYKIKIPISMFVLSSRPFDVLQEAYSDHWDAAFAAFRIERKWGKQ